MSKDFAHQLPLVLDYSAQEDDYDEFIVKQANRILLGKGLTLVCGSRSAGKIRFMKALLKEAGLRNLATYSLEADDAHDHSYFEEAGGCNLVCLDNLKKVCGKPDWELSLFHLINFMEDTKKKLVFGTSVPPDKLEVNLADLGSRLRAADRVYLGPFND